MSVWFGSATAKWVLPCSSYPKVIHVALTIMKFEIYYFILQTCISFFVAHSLIKQCHFPHNSICERSVQSQTLAQLIRGNDLIFFDGINNEHSNELQTTWDSFFYISIKNDSLKLHYESDYFPVIQTLDTWLQLRKFVIVCFISHWPRFACSESTKSRIVRRHEWNKSSISDTRDWQIN